MGEGEEPPRLAHSARVRRVVRAVSRPVRTTSSRDDDQTDETTEATEMSQPVSDTTASDAQFMGRARVVAARPAAAVPRTPGSAA